MALIRKKIACAVLLAVYLLSLSQGANASLQDSLNGMFQMANSTAPGLVATQNRGALVGGGVAMRSGIQAINIAAFDPPRFNAGCGGLDVFGGSFSFINSQQLVSLFRSIAANSVGMAFQLAISAINPSLAGMMEKFQKMVQEMNKAMGDSCHVAQGLFAMAKNSIGTEEAVDSDSSMIAQATGAASSFFDGITSRISSFNQGAINVAKNPTQLAQSKQGNPVWKAITTTLPSGSMPNGYTMIDSNAQFSNEILMSLVGTIWVGPSPQATTSTDNKTETDSSTNTTKQYPAIIVLHDLIVGNTDGRKLKKYTCYDTQSCWITSAPGGDTFSYDGIAGYVNKMLFGAADITAGIQSGSILDVIQTGGAGFTKAQSDFLSQFRTPVVGALKKSATNSFMVQQAGADLASLMVTELALKYGELADRQARTIFAGTTYQKPDGFDESRKILKKDVDDLRVKEEKTSEEIVKKMRWIDTMVQSFPQINNGYRK
jgi:conjugative transfer pilus assembly protein TraH